MIYKNNKKAVIPKNIRKTFIYIGQTINEALKKISSSGYKICIVLDAKHNFKGVLNDGDIRRALLKGNSLKSKIDKIYNQNPIIFKENSVENKIIKKLTSQGVEHAPIIKKKKSNRNLF